MKILQDFHEFLSRLYKITKVNSYLHLETPNFKIQHIFFKFMIDELYKYYFLIVFLIPPKMCVIMSFNMYWPQLNIHWSYRWRWTEDRRNTPWRCVLYFLNDRVTTSEDEFYDKLKIHLKRSHCVTIPNWKCNPRFSAFQCGFFNTFRMIEKCLLRGLYFKKKMLFRKVISN